MVGVFGYCTLHRGIIKEWNTELELHYSRTIEIWYLHSRCQQVSVKLSVKPYSLCYGRNGSVFDNLRSTIPLLVYPLKILV